LNSIQEFELRSQAAMKMNFNQNIQCNVSSGEENTAPRIFEATASLTVVHIHIRVSAASYPSVATIFPEMMLEASTFA
jgi:hypothetical protein